MYGIDLTVNPPVLQKPCMTACGYCVRICPTGALSDEGMAKAGLPSDKEREISAMLFKKHYLDPLAQAEAEGRFRRLVPVEDIVHGVPREPNEHPQ